MVSKSIKNSCCYFWFLTKNKKHKTQTIIGFVCMIMGTYFYHCNFVFKFMRHHTHTRIHTLGNNGYQNHPICGRYRVKTHFHFEIKCDRNSQHTNRKGCYYRSQEKIKSILTAHYISFSRDSVRHFYNF